MAKHTYNLHLKGYVGGCDFDRDYVDYILANNAGKPVSVLIDSLGGSLATALSIASAFNAHGDVSVHFVGMNASAATIASLGASSISMDSSAMYLVHKCSSEFFQYGNLNADDIASLIKDLKATKRDLDKLDANIAEMYAAKCKKPANELLDLMKAGGWLTAKEALDWGFVDEITDFEDESAPKLTDAVASAMASAGMPIPNVPMADEQSAFGKFLAAIAEFFKPKAAAADVLENQEQESNPNIVEQHTPIITMHTFTNLCTLLSVENMAATDGKITLSVEQMQAIEDAVTAARQREQDLVAEVTQLREKPGEDTTTVVNNGKSPQQEEKSDVEQFVDTVNSARSLYNMLPKV